MDQNIKNLNKELNQNPASRQGTDIKKDEKYMREAIRQAKKAYALEEAITAVPWIKIHWPMQNSLPFERHAEKWRTGGWRNVPCTSP